MEMATKTSSTGNSNIVYVAINAAMPRYCKVGITGDIWKQLKELKQPVEEEAPYTATVQMPFRCAYALKTENETSARFIEKNLLDIFAPKKERNNKGFLKVRYEKVIAALDLCMIGGMDVTQEITQNSPQIFIVGVKRERNVGQEGKKVIKELPNFKQRPKFNFGMVHLGPGAELVFIKDKRIKVTVVDNQMVTFKEERYEPVALSPAAQKAGIKARIAQGTVYWVYDDPVYGKETLDERRRRMEFYGILGNRI